MSDFLSNIKAISGVNYNTKINKPTAQTAPTAQINGAYSQKELFNFGNANPTRPEARSQFTAQELCGAPVKGNAVYYLC